MTNEEKDRLIAYLVDAGEIDPEGDVEAQFLEWRQVHEQVVSGEVHYKAILEAAALVREDMSTLIPDSTAQSVEADGHVAPGLPTRWSCRIPAALPPGTRRTPPRCFLLMASSFLCSTPGFFAGSPSKIVSILYIRVGGLHLSFFHFQDLDIRLSSLLIGSSTE